MLGAEALVRWAHPARGVHAPDTFIPVAERSELIVALDRWVLRAACRQLAAWTAEYGRGAPAVLNVNVSARGLREPDFAADVAAVLAGYGVEADRIVLEVTETMVLEPGASVTALQQLRRLGVRVSLDDFGTGQSTLSLLHECPVDEIKLDRFFTQAAVPGLPTMAATVMYLARAMGLHVVAEGVETADQAALLSSLGYGAAQGFHFARPMAAVDIDEMLRDPMLSPRRPPSVPVG
jgi:EAL domain-containing protein (putative c-di-GMP-specific phosphodiesterase class I)